MANLENILSFKDFEKSWNPKTQKSTKRTEVGLDVLNENLYMKVMDQGAAGWAENVKKFIVSINKAIDENQIKDIKIVGNSVSFTIRGRKYKVDKQNGTIVLQRVKATATRKKYIDDGGREKEERKRIKTREDIEVNVPISKSEATAIYDKIKDMADDEDDD